MSKDRNSNFSDSKSDLTLDSKTERELKKIEEIEGAATWKNLATTKLPRSRNLSRSDKEDLEALNILKWLNRQELPTEEQPLSRSETESSDDERFQTALSRSKASSSEYNSDEDISENSLLPTQQANSRSNFDTDSLSNELIYSRTLPSFGCKPIESVSATPSSGQRSKS